MFLLCVYIIIVQRMIGSSACGVFASINSHGRCALLESSSEIDHACRLLLRQVVLAYTLHVYFYRQWRDLR